MSAIVLISVLVLPIVYLLGLPPYNCELIGSLAFGLGTLTALVMLFVPKVMVVYAPGLSRKSSKVAAIAADILSASGTLTGSMESDPETSNTFQDSERMLKGKSREQRMLICQEQMTGWQALLMRQQAAAMNTTDSKNSASGTGGVSRSSYEMPGREAIQSSQLQPDLDMYPPIERESLFTANYTLPALTEGHNNHHDLEMQDA
jgi:hypothetical protein